MFDVWIFPNLALRTCLLLPYHIKVVLEESGMGRPAPKQEGPPLLAHLLSPNDVHLELAKQVEQLVTADAVARDALAKKCAELERTLGSAILDISKLRDENAKLQRKLETIMQDSSLRDIDG